MPIIQAKGAHTRTISISVEWSPAEVLFGKSEFDNLAHRLSSRVFISWKIVGSWPEDTKLETTSRRKKTANRCRYSSTSEFYLPFTTVTLLHLN